MKQIVTIIVKQVYGNFVIYPDNEAAKTFAAIAGGEAAYAAENPGLDTAHWDTEEQLRAALTTEALEFIDERELQLALTRISHRAGEAVKAGTQEAAALDDISDEALLSLPPQPAGATFGSEEQKRRFLPGLARGELLGAFALASHASAQTAPTAREERQSGARNQKTRELPAHQNETSSDEARRHERRVNLPEASGGSQRRPGGQRRWR